MTWPIKTASKPKFRSCHSITIDVFLCSRLCERTILISHSCWRIFQCGQYSLMAILLELKGFAFFTFRGAARDWQWGWRKKRSQIYGLLVQIMSTGKLLCKLPSFESTNEVWHQYTSISPPLLCPPEWGIYTAIWNSLPHKIWSETSPACKGMQK